MIISQERVQQIVDSLMNLDDICKWLDCSRQSITLWRRQENLPVIVIRGERKSAIRFYKPAVLSWLKNHKLNKKRRMDKWKLKGPPPAPLPGLVKAAEEFSGLEPRPIIPKGPKFKRRTKPSLTDFKLPTIGIDDLPD